MDRNLIITADDYGMADSVNQAIDECMGAGAVNSTCVMANMPAVEPARSLRSRFPRVSIGLHWNLTQGRPLLPPEQVPSLVDSQGRLMGVRDLKQRVLIGKVSMTEVRAELRAQHRRFEDLVGRPDYWNTHEGFHVAPRLFRFCVALALELGIPAMRSHRRITVPYTGTRAAFLRSHPAYWIKGRLLSNWATGAERLGMRMPDGIVKVPGFPEGVSMVDAILERIDWAQCPRAAELTVHPAVRVEAELFGSMTESRLREFRVFSDPLLVDRLRLAGVAPTGFEVLQGAQAR